MPRMEIKNIIEKAGGARAVADLTGVSVQAVYQWKTVPAPHVLKMAEVLRVDPYELRPDVFPKPRRAG